MKSPFMQIIIKIAVTLLIIAGVFYFLISPKLKDLADNQIEVERLGSDLKQADDKLSELKTLDKNKDQLAQTKREIYNLLPDEASASSFILDMESASSEVGVIVDSLSVNEIKTAKSKPTGDSDAESAAKAPTTPAKTNADKTLGFSASVTSDYTKLQSLLKHLELLSRFNTIEAITLSNYRPNDSTMTLKTEGKIYYGK